MNIFRIIAGLLVGLSLSMQSAVAAPDVPDVAERLTAWTAAIETGTVDQVMEMYDRDAVMFSVFAVKPLETPKAMRNYYEEVFKNPDRKVQVTQSQVRTFGNVALNSGLYRISYKQDGETIVIPSRFSFTYVLKDGEWIIIEHHSSKVPLAELE